MSILNAWVSAKAATIATDTECYLYPADGGGPRIGSRSKFETLPHLAAAIAHRGDATFSEMVLARARARGFSTFDELLDELPTVLSDTEVYTIGNNVQAYRGCEGAEFAAVGWSKRQGRMLGRAFIKHASMDDMVGFISTPWRIEDFDLLVLPGSIDEMSDELLREENVARLAAAQVRHMRANGACGGGTLILCRLTEHQVNVTLAGAIGVNSRPHHPGAPGAKSQAVPYPR